MNAPALSDPVPFVQRLRERIPGLAIDTSELDLYRTDIFYESDWEPLAVVAPRSQEEVQTLVRAAGEIGISLSSRGAGLSYSAGYIPANDHTVIVDTRHLNRIVEINERDRYVTVESGVTWASLYEALQGTGLQPPFWGTFSGRRATIGAGVSQGAKFYGSGYRGTSAESVIGLKVVTGKGDLVTTGSAASIHRPTPFYRNYGPDLTGMFLADSGAFGIKVEVTLQLVPAAKEIDVAAFSFLESGPLMEAMATIGAEALASEAFALDPASVRARLVSEGVGEDLKTLKAVVDAGGSRLKGLKDAAALALGGRRFADKVGFMLSCVTEGRDDHDARSRMQRVREIVAQYGGTETSSSVPRVMRSKPFPEPNGILSPSGKRINWLHTVVPNSRASECYEVTESVYARHQEAVERFGIEHGYFLTANGPSGVGVETLIYWRDGALPIHRHYSHRIVEKVGPGEPDPQARAAVGAITRDIIRIWSEMGAVHLQIGRKYPYLATRQEPTAALLRSFKEIVDPLGIINPGNLFSTYADEGEQL
jgi:D-lactate dehydrogenase (cytochrome)